MKKLRRKQRQQGGASSSPRSKRRKTRILERYASLAGLKNPSTGAHRQLLRFPKTFSFIEAPDDAIGLINRLVNSVRRPAAQTIELDQSDCEFIDYGAEAVSTAIALEANRHFHLSFSGSFPEDDELRKVIAAVGVPHYLGVDLPAVPEIERFPLSRGRKRAEKATKSSERDIVSSNLTMYINRCLAHYGFGLKRPGLNKVSTLVSEVIGNAEDHSGTKNWWVAGYLQQGDEHGDCHICIFNFGRTLAESLRQLPDDAQLRANIERLVERHRSRGFFGIRGWEPERLWSLYALQQGVSRFNDDAHAVGDRGQGTVQLIRFFQTLGETERAASPRMSVVSGQTQFLFDGTYRMEARQLNGKVTRHIIAFNKTNDLEKPPDRKSVRKIDRYFPGSLISLRFYFDQRYLRQLGEEGNA